MTDGWRAATVMAKREETATARTLVLDVPGWPGQLAGQHVKEETANALVDLGYAADMIFTERFGPTGSRNRAA